MWPSALLYCTWPLRQTSTEWILSHVDTSDWSGHWSSHNFFAVGRRIRTLVEVLFGFDRKLTSMYLAYTEVVVTYILIFSCSMKRQITRVSDLEEDRSA